MESFEEAWGIICSYCKTKITDVAYNTWISRIEPIELDFDKNKAVILVPNDFHRQTITRCYLSLLNEAFEAVFGQIFVIEMKIPEEISVKEEQQAAANAEITDISYEYTFDTFIVGSSNKFAHAACLAVATNPANAYNPLFLYGNSGLGKTHLLYAIGNEIKKNSPEKTICYIKGDDFTNELIESLRMARMSEFRKKYRQADILLVDDVQFIGGKESTQEEFFHTFNHLHNAGKQIVISSDKPPKDMTTLEARLRTRFEWGLIADISVPDYETRMAILYKKIELDQLERYQIPDEVIQYIAMNIKTNIRELEGSLNKLIALYRIGGRKNFDVSLAADALKDMIAPDDSHKVTPELVLDVVSDHFNVSVSELKGSRRNARTAGARQIVMYLCRQMTDASLQSIGDLLGGRDHSTVNHGVDKIARDVEKDETLRNTIEIIQKKISPL